MTSLNLKPLILFVVLLAVWQAVCSLYDIPAFILPSPANIVISIDLYSAQLMRHSLSTLWVTGAGLGLSVLFAVPLGLIVGASRGVYDTVYPLLVAFNAIPKVAILPAIVIWFGIGAVPAILTAFSLAFFPIVVNLAIAIRTMEPEIQDVLRSLGASRMQILIKIGLPRSLPYFFAGFKVAITLAFVGSVLAETVAGSVGIGYLMMAASSRLDLSLVFAGLTVIAAMSVLFFYLVEFIERRTTLWATRGMDA